MDTPLVSMTSITDHTYDGIDRPIGTVYDVDPQYVETVIALHFARRTEHLASGGKKKPAKAAAPPDHDATT